MLTTIERNALAVVTGGRYQKKVDTDPKLLQMIQQLAEAVKAAGANIAQAHQQSFGQLMQVMQQKMEEQGGGGGKGGKKK